jgi:2,5-diamino-6-(ribosylamino)-4(3H)-pyrimidinone 5'-phosphate reductase
MATPCSSSERTAIGKFDVLGTDLRLFKSSVVTPPSPSRKHSRFPRKTPSRAALPFVFVNMAMTADGKIATANREVSSFGSPRDHGHLLELRATADAVLAGARTVDSAEVNLGPGPERYRRLRLRRGLSEYNLRIIVSRTGSVNPNATIFKHRFSPIVVLTTAKASAARLARLRTLADQVKICGDTEIDFSAAFRWLRQRWRVRRLLCEGGGELNDALFRARLVDEVHLTICPLIFGGKNAPTIADGEGVSALNLAADFELMHQRHVGEECFFSFGRTAPSRRSRPRPK